MDTPPTDEPIETPETDEEFVTTIITEGCYEGLGYYQNSSPKICYPLDRIGEDPPSDFITCKAFGCLYSPPKW
jgi:hypothetical protein